MRQINEFVASLYNLQPNLQKIEPVYEEIDEKNDWYEC